MLSSAVCWPRAHCGNTPESSLCPHTDLLARSARSQLLVRFARSSGATIRPRSALLGCQPARHGGNQPGLGPGPSSAGRRAKGGKRRMEGEASTGAERGRRDLGRAHVEARRCTCLTVSGVQGKPRGGARGQGVGECAQARRQPLRASGASGCSTWGCYCEPASPE